MECETGRSEGFSFVEMDSGAQAQAAIGGMNGQSLNEPATTVKEAHPPRTCGFGNSNGHCGC